MPVSHANPLYLRNALKLRPLPVATIPTVISGNASMGPTADSNVGTIDVYSTAASGSVVIQWPVSPPGASGIFVSASDGVSVSWTANAATHVATIAWTRTGAAEAPFFLIYYEPM